MKRSNFLKALCLAPVGLAAGKATPDPKVAHGGLIDPKWIKCRSSTACIDTSMFPVGEWIDVRCVGSLDGKLNTYWRRSHEPIRS